MQARGYPDAMDMTPGRLLFVSRVVSEIDDTDFYSDAMATRLGHHGTDKDWEQIRKDRLR